MVNEVADAMVERLMAKAKEGSQEVAQMIGDPDLMGVFNGGTKEFSNNKQKYTIFNTETGERVEIPLMYLKKTLQKKRRITMPDGSEKVIDAFVPAHEETGRPLSPVPEYKVGNLKCFLHPQHPEREWLVAIGVSMDVVCGDNETRPAGSFKTTFTRDYHEKKKHPITWAVREEARKAQKEQEQIDRQERQIEAMMALASGRQPVAEVEIHYCDEDGCPRFFDSAQGLTLHKGRDHK